MKHNHIPRVAGILAALLLTILPSFAQDTTPQKAPTNLTDYRGKQGQRFTFKVKASRGGRIWGGENNIYTDDSDLATACCHAGVLTDGQEGSVVVEIRADQGSYPSITRNGITSTSYGAWKGAYRIIGTAVAGAKIPTNENIKDAPGDMTSYRGANGKVLTFRVTGKTGGRIWGGENNTYTDDSNIATAAVHAGLVKNGETAVIKVTVREGRSSYPSITRNGITSTQYGAWHGSYSLSR